MPFLSSQVNEINEIFLRKYLQSLKSEKEKFRDFKIEEASEEEILNYQIALQRFEIAEKLQKIFDFQKSKEVSQEELEIFISSLFGIERFGKSLQDFKDPLFIELMNEFAKINDIFKRLRIFVNQQFFEKNNKGQVADSLDYVLDIFAKKELSRQQVQELLEKARFSPSLTAHPTNATSVEYTKTAMAFVEAFTAKDEEFSQRNLEKALEALKNVKISGKKKTQKDEIEEGLAYLDSFYDGIEIQYRKMQEALDSSQLYRGLKLPQNMNQPCVWLAGDGDGNVNATEETLLLNVQMFQIRIKQRYQEELNKIGLRISIDSFESKEEFLRYLENELKDAGNQERVRQIKSLMVKVQTFGFEYAKIDVRHEASDIMKSVVSLLVAARNQNQPRFNEIIPSDLAVENITNEKLLEILQNQEIIQTIRALDYKMVDFGEYDELTKRVFGRFKIVAQNPEMFEKIIIAEFKGAEQISAVLLMLKASGNKVCEIGSKINIVPLAESKDDLEKLDQDIYESLKQPAYFEHVRHNKKIYFMIAKSDTVRRNGVGAQYYQEMAIRNSIKSIIRALIENNISLEEIAEFEIIPFNGGGHALQRGGGRLTELASVYGRYALRAVEELKDEYEKEGYANLEEIFAKIDAVKILPPCLTTQGHQNGILYHPKEVGAGTLQAFNSQAIYAAARKSGLVEDLQIDSKWRESLGFEVDSAKLVKWSQEVLQGICDAAIQAYSIHVGHEKSKAGSTPIDRLFNNGPWLSVITNNKSSRSNKRGGADEERPQAIFEAKGETGKSGNSLLKWRAITTEKICAHSQTNLISWFGWFEGLQEAKSQGVKLHDLYSASKTFRDYMRSSAMALYMTDFESAWNLMLGQNPPETDEFLALVDSYNFKMSQGKQDEITDAETLAFVEFRAEETKALVYEAITGKEVEIFDGFDVMEKFQEVKLEIDKRKENCAFANFTQARINNLANQAENKFEIFDEELQQVSGYSYCASDVAANAPLGSQHTSTKQRVHDLKRQEAQEVEVLTNAYERYAEPEQKVASRTALSAIEAGLLQAMKELEGR